MKIETEHDGMRETIAVMARTMRAHGVGRMTCGMLTLDLTAAPLPAPVSVEVPDAAPTEQTDDDVGHVVRRGGLFVS
jgi:hypothetical protein